MMDNFGKQLEMGQPKETDKETKRQKRKRKKIEETCIECCQPPSERARTKKLQLVSLLVYDHKKCSGETRANLTIRARCKRESCSILQPG